MNAYFGQFNNVVVFLSRTELKHCLCRCIYCIHMKVCTMHERIDQVRMKYACLIL